MVPADGGGVRAALGGGLPEGLDRGVEGPIRQVVDGAGQVHHGAEGGGWVREVARRVERRQGRGAVEGEVGLDGLDEGREVGQRGLGLTRGAGEGEGAVGAEGSALPMGLRLGRGGEGRSAQGEKAAAVHAFAPRKLGVSGRPLPARTSCTQAAGELWIVTQSRHWKHSEYWT